VTFTFFERLHTFSRTMVTAASIVLCIGHENACWQIWGIVWTNSDDIKCL